MRIGLIGSGALASLFAAQLAGVAEVVMAGSWQPQLQAMALGLTYIHLDGTESVHQVEVVAEGQQTVPLQVALVLVKSYQTAQAIDRLQTLLAPDGLAITLQNGLGNLELLAAAVGRGRATLGVVTLGATMVRPGVVRHAGEGWMALAPPPQEHPAFANLILALRQAGQRVRVTDDVNGLLWGKLAINAAINPLTAVLDVDNGVLAAHRPLRLVMAAAAQEVAAVAAAQHISLPFVDAGAEAIGVAKATAGNRSSMRQDIANGRATEIEAICGAVVQAGAAHGIATPVNAQLWRWVQLVSEKNAISNWRIQLPSAKIDLEPYFRDN